MATIEAPPLICIVEEDESVREALLGWLQALGHSCDAFVNVEEFLASSSSARTHCLILDPGGPSLSAQQLVARVVAAQPALPIIVTTALVEGRTCERLLRAGACACLRKPFLEEPLLDAIRAALAAGNMH